MDDTLKSLLRYVKREDYDATWQGLREQVLGVLYHHEMRFIDVLSVLMRSYSQALMEPRFELPGRHSAAEDLVLAPVKGSHAIEFMGAAAMDQRYSVEQFYGAMIRKMLSDLRLARVDWCAGDIWPDGRATASHHPQRLTSSRE
ncbi:hypothetical protein [Burkholderia gladioli]|uniref:hypothetical protein n=1 Tax=Burkholderia gladioli TaxID=28095 RepID=UPI001641BC46|nr:hypothetical protein [Burkholderia gladioli]